MQSLPEGSRSSVPRGGAVLLLVLLVGAVTYFFGRHSRAEPPGSAQGEGQTAQATLDDAARASGKSPAASTKANGRRLAPHDTFYLLQYVSAKTPTGVIGFEPGQEVHLVEVHQESQTLVVGDGQAQVEVGPEKLTNDMDIAALVSQKDQANQAKIAAYVQSEQQAYQESKRQAAIKTEQALDKIDQEKQQQAATVVAQNNERTPASAGVNSPTKLDEPAVPVGGTSGYGYAGSAYYGSPYSYFGGTTGTTATAPAATGNGAASGTATRPANVGTAGR